MNDHDEPSDGGTGRVPGRAVDVRDMFLPAIDAVLSRVSSSADLEARLEVLRAISAIAGAVAGTQGKLGKAIEVAKRMPSVPHMPIAGPMTARFIKQLLGHMIDTGEVPPDWTDFFSVAQISDSLECLEQGALETVRGPHSSQRNSASDMRQQAAQIVLGSVKRIRELLDIDDSIGALANALVLLAHASSDEVIAGSLVRLGSRKGRDAKAQEAAAEARALLLDVKKHRAQHSRHGRKAVAIALYEKHGNYDPSNADDSKERAVMRLMKRIERAEKKTK